jgi:uncharacterized protein DUF1775
VSSRVPHTARVRRGRGAASAAVGAATAVLLSLLLGVQGAAGATTRAVPDAQGGIVIEPDNVEPGARDVTLAFRLTDVDPASPVVRFELFLPTGRPLLGVEAPALPGWTAELTTTVLPAPAPSADGPVREIVSAVAWTAAVPPPAGAPEFTLHVDLMPEGAGPVRFRAMRTDTGGRTVEWSDTWALSGPRPAHDAVKLALGTPRQPPVAAAPHADHHGAGGAALPVREATPGGIAMTVGGLLAAGAAVGALAAVLARRQRRRFEAVRARERKG